MNWIIINNLTLGSFHANKVTISLPSIFIFKYRIEKRLLILKVGMVNSKQELKKVYLCSSLALSISEINLVFCY